MAPIHDRMHALLCQEEMTEYMAGLVSIYANLL